MSDAPLSPPESITGKPTRRRYSLALKWQIVEASLRPGVSATLVARQYELNGNLLHTWRW
jgi:transposase